MFYVVNREIIKIKLYLQEFMIVYKLKLQLIYNIFKRFQGNKFINILDYLIILFQILKIYLYIMFILCVYNKKWNDDILGFLVYYLFRKLILII